MDDIRKSLSKLKKDFKHRFGGKKRAPGGAGTDTAGERVDSSASTAFATAKLLLRGVRDAADAFGPLKSVAGGLCFILENCEV